MGAEQSMEKSQSTAVLNSGHSNEAPASPMPSRQFSIEDGVPTLCYGGSEVCIRRHKEQRRLYRNMKIYGGSKGANLD